MVAGTTRVLHASGVAETVPFFRPAPEAPPPRSLRTAVAMGVDLLANAVKARCEGAGPVGVLASGGLDSTIVAALAARACDELALPRPVLFHVSSPGFAADERPYAERLAEVLGLELVVRDIRHRSASAAHFTEFFGMTTPAFVGLFEDATVRGVRVMLTGEGGDETQFPTGRELDDLLADKEWIAAARFAGLVGSTGRPRLRQVLRTLVQPWLPPAVFEERSLQRACAALPRWLTPKGRRHALDAILERHAGEFDREHPLPHKRTIAAHQVWSSAMTISHQMQNALAARHGVELRHPFFDPAVYDFTNALPTSLLVSPELQKPFLREVCAALVPRDLAFRPPPTDYSNVHRSLWDSTFAAWGARIRGVPELVALGIVELEPFLEDLEGSAPAFEVLNVALAQEWFSQMRGHTGPGCG